MRFSPARLVVTVIVCLLVLVNVFFYTGLGTANSTKSYLAPQKTDNAAHLLCVLIPFRNVEHELSVLVPELSDFLNNQAVKHRIIVLNQTDSYRFNRASLINVGWFEADTLGCDYMVMHDVDIVPLNPALSYKYPGEGVVRHISSGDYHPIKRYNYKKFIGGVLMLTMVDFKRINGMSNKYWGWGLEDDELYLRMKDAGLVDHIERPQNLTTDRLTTFKHIHGPERKRDYAMIGNQKKMSRKRDRVSGLNSVKYSVESRETLLYRDVQVLSLHIQLECDFSWTPYCSFTSH